MRVPTAGQMTTSPISITTLKALEEQRRGAIAQLLGGSDGTPTYTIASGAIKPTTGMFLVDTEGAAASDNLDRITVEANVTVTGFSSHGFLILQAANTARTVVVKHLAGGADQIRLADDVDFSLDDDKKALALIHDGSVWREVGRFFGADAAAARTFLGVTLFAALANPSDPGDNGKYVTANAGAWQLTTPTSGEQYHSAGVTHEDGNTTNQADGSVIKFNDNAEYEFGPEFRVDGKSIYYTPEDGYCEVQSFSQFFPKDSDEDKLTIVTVRMSKGGVIFGITIPFDDTGLSGARGLPSKSVLLVGSTLSANRLQDVASNFSAMHMEASGGLGYVKYRALVSVQGSSETRIRKNHWLALAIGGE